MRVLVLSLLGAALTTWLVVWSARMHGHRSGDRDFSKPQKLHTTAVPRIGGLGIVIGVMLACTVLPSDSDPQALSLAWKLLACAAPAFLVGFVQDFTEAMSPRRRLVAAALSAVLAHYVLGATIRVTEIPGLDWVVGFELGALLVTVFAVSGTANAVNIIDGLNGLAGMVGVLMLAAIAHVAWQAGDPWVSHMALAGIGGVLGFLLWNYPGGRIFMGDGGAYFLGFYVAELAILLLVRQSEVSPMFPLLACLYPIYETVFSMYRRIVLHRRPPHMPDGNHLHTLVYRRLLRPPGVRRQPLSPTRRNSMSAPVLWLLCLIAVVPAVLWWRHTSVLAVCIAGFAFCYSWLYWRIVRFRVPRWLRRVLSAWAAWGAGRGA